LLHQINQVVKEINRITGLHVARVQVQHEHRTVADLIRSVNEQEYWDVLRYADDDIEEAEVIDEAP
jgi:hypothetical protein